MKKCRYFLNQFRSFIRRCIMMLLERNIAQNIVLSLRIGLGSKIPRLLLWIFFVVLHSFKLIFEIYNVKCLFISECSVLLKILNVLISRWVSDQLNNSLEICHYLVLSKIIEYMIKLGFS